MGVLTRLSPFRARAESGSGRARSRAPRNLTRLSPVRAPTQSRAPHSLRKFALAVSLAAGGCLDFESLGDLYHPAADSAVTADLTAAAGDLRGTHDLATVADMAPHDLAMPQDSAMSPPDSTLPPDQTAPPDLSPSRDLAPPPDLAPPQDLAPPPDLTPPPPVENTCGAVFTDGLASRSVQAPHVAAYNVPGALTIEAWIVANVFPAAGTQALIAGHASATPLVAPAYGLYLGQAGIVSFQVRGADGNPYQVSATAPISQWTWTHVAGTWDPTSATMRIWVDGQSTSFTQIPGALSVAADSGPLLVANTGANNPAMPFTGFIDEVRVSTVVRYFTPGLPPKYLMPDAQTVALYHFTEASGTLALDSSQTGNPATLVGGATFFLNCPYRCGSLALGGDYVQAPAIAALSPSGSFTVEAWVQPHAPGNSANANILDQHVNGGSRSYHLFIQLPSMKPGFETSCDGNNWDTALQGWSIPLDKWTHMAGTFDAVNRVSSLWINGLMVAQTAQFGCSTVFATSAPLTIASTFYGFEGMQGYFDELRISNGLRYVAPTQYAPPIAPFTGDAADIALYHFDEANGTVAHDVSSNFNNAAISGPKSYFAPGCF
jgi:hypothetical protein